jgi:hypothetical protein
MPWSVSQWGRTNTVRSTRHVPGRTPTLVVGTSLSPGNGSVAWRLAARRQTPGWVGIVGT